MRSPNDQFAARWRLPVLLAILTAAFAPSVYALAPIVRAQQGTPTPSPSPTVTGSPVPRATASPGVGITGTPSPTGTAVPGQAPNTSQLLASALRAELRDYLTPYVETAAMAAQAIIAGNDEQAASHEMTLNEITNSIAAFMGVYYGPELRDDLEPLAMDYTEALIAYAEAVAADNQDARDDAIAELESTIDEIAALVTSESDAWSENELADMIHPQSLLDAIDAYAEGNTVDAQSLRNESSQHAAGVADATVEAIMSDFAEEFQGTRAEIRLSLYRTIQAWNQRNAQTFMEGFTTQGFMEEFGLPKEQAAGELQMFMGSPPIHLRELTFSEISSNEVTVDVELGFGIAAERSRDTWVRQPNGQWAIDTSETLPAQAPANASTVPVSMVEYSFEFDPNDIQAGERVVFDASNDGEEPHELALIRIDEDAPSLEQLLLQAAQQGEMMEPPPGIAFLAGTFAEPGDSAQLVLTTPIDPGRYGFVCFVPTEQGVPHAALGMISEFTVEEE